MNLDKNGQDEKHAENVLVRNITNCVGDQSVNVVSSALARCQLSLLAGMARSTTELQELIDRLAAEMKEGARNIDPRQLGYILDANSNDPIIYDGTKEGK